MIQNIFRAVSAYPKALGLVFKMGLWGYFFIPALLSLCFAGVLYFLASFLMTYLGGALVTWYPFEWGSGFVTSASNWIAFFLIGAIGLLMYKHIILFLVAPFMSALSAKVEKNLTGGNIGTENQGMKGLLRSGSLALRNFSRELLFSLPLLILSFVPVIGLAASILLFIIQAYYTGFGNFDCTLERHYNRKQSIAFVRKHRGLAIGNGLVFLLLIFSIVGILVAPPLATIAATLEVHRLREQL